MTDLEQETMTGAATVAAHFDEVAQLFRKAAQSGFPAQVGEAAARIGDAFEQGNKLLIFGNGGSASDAQHLCGELVVRFKRNRRALPAMALCCDAAVMTACGNDFSYEDIFARQIEALGQPGDVALGISTSGNSLNVMRAFEAARARGLATILLTGQKQGPACNGCDLVLAAPAPDTACVQELHLAAYHSMCELLELRFAQ